MTPACPSALRRGSHSPPAPVLGLTGPFELVENERNPKMSRFLPTGCAGTVQQVLDNQGSVPGL